MEPTRKCIACNGRFPKSSLLRIVKSQDGTITYDPTGKAAGRGAYVCQNEACIRAVVEKRQLSRAYRQNVERTAYATLEEMLENEDRR